MIPLLLASACAPAPVKFSDDSVPTAETDTDTDTDTDADSDTDADTDTDTDTGPDPGGDWVQGVEVAVHEDVHTLLVVSWTQARPASRTWVEYSFEGETWESPVVAREAGEAQQVLLGIPAEMPVDVRVYAAEGGDPFVSPVVPAETGTLPEDLLSPTVTVWDEALASPERWMLGTIDVGENWYYGPYYVFLLDRQGRYVWYWEVPDGRGSLYAQPGWDGSHILVDANAQYAWYADHAGYFRLSLDLSRADEYVVPHYGFAADEYSDGSMLFESRADNQYHLARHDPDGTVTQLWDCTPYFVSIGANPSTCSPNTIVWDPDRNTVLWSMYRVDTVLEIDLDTGEVLKQFGQLPGGWTFDPVESTVDYQHYVNWTPDGTLIASTHYYGERGEQRTWEYEVDEATQTLTRVWGFGETVDHYADYAGEAWRLPNRNTMIGYGVDGVQLEVTYDGEIAWQVEWPSRPNTHLIGHMSLVDDLYALNGQ